MISQERIRAVVEKVAQKPIPADPEESLFESGVLDSFALPDMIGELEKEFHLKVPDADLTPRKFDSVARIADYLSVHVS
ncbi:MAG TPA: acyl carrier protein [Bryobacteraceae bacterium]|jgi:acyl carrier protein|nr:acyl carrier protein [Bryobacteraceae bacterium]